MGVLAGLLQNLPERWEDVAWIDGSKGMGDGRVGKKNADTFIGTDDREAPTIRFFIVFLF